MSILEPTPEQIAELRRMTPEQMAKEICSVQPIDPKFFNDFMKASKSESELIAEGYEPVCPATRLMWIKKNDDTGRNSGNVG
jgi:hypothetical protein